VGGCSGGSSFGRIAVVLLLTVAFDLLECAEESCTICMGPVEGALVIGFKLVARARVDSERHCCAGRV